MVTRTYFFLLNHKDNKAVAAIPSQPFSLAPIDFSQRYNFGTVAEYSRDR